MRLFLISNMYPNANMPGYGVFVKNVAEGLLKEGVEIPYTALIRGRGTDLLKKMTKYISFYFSIVIYYFRKYDLIYVHYPTYSAPLLLLLYRIKKKRIITNLHGEDLLILPGRLSQFLGLLGEKIIVRSSLVVVPSDYFKEVLISRNLIEPDKIMVSPSGGIDPDIFFPLKKEKIEKEFKVGFIGRIVPEKGIIEFIESLKEINKYIDCYATIIGRGEYCDKMKESINQYGLESKINTIEYIEQGELNRYYTSFDLFIFPTKRKEESFGLVGVESMACGVPVIGSAIGGVPSYLKDGYNGYLVEPGNVRSIVNAVINYYNLDDDSKKQMINNAISTGEIYRRDAVIKELFYRFQSL